MNKIRIIAAAIIAAITTAATTLCAFAEEGGGIASSTAVTGTKNLLNDISNALLIIAPIIGTVCIIYFAVRHGAADEMDQKKWKQRIVVAAVSIIVAVIASALINVLIGYYQ